MKNLSLRLRSFIAALLAMLFFVPLAALVLEQAFNSSLTESIKEQLQLQGLNLISEFELQDNQAVMPEYMFNQKLNMPGSGLYAIIQIAQETVWRSESTLSLATFPEFSPPSLGESEFNEITIDNVSFFEYAYTAEFDSGNTFKTVTFYVLQDKYGFLAANQSFNSTLYKWLAVVALFLLALLFISLHGALKPITTLIKEIKLAEGGQTDRIHAQFSPELEELKSSINHLLDTEEQQRSRYKNSLSDLAHSLKTPLAVLKGNQALPDSAQEPVAQINNIIQRQLKRAVSDSTSAFKQQTQLAPIVEKLANAMTKVYADKKLLVISDCEQELTLNVDSTDILELLGNLVDNASKAAFSQVSIKCVLQPTRLSIIIEDDGKGISEQNREKLLTRGTRLDSYQEGQGIGMAVVTDLLNAYQGKLEISNSPLGGAKFTVHFFI